MRVKTDKPICVGSMKELLNAKDYNTLYKKLNYFVKDLWSQDQLTDVGYNEMKYAIDKCFENNKVLKKQNRKLELTYRIFPEDNNKDHLKIECLKNGKWKYVSYVYGIWNDFKSKDDIWKGFEDALYDWGYDGDFTHADYTMEIIIKSKTFNMKTAKGEAQVIIDLMELA